MVEVAYEEFHNKRVKSFSINLHLVDLVINFYIFP